MDGLIVPRPGRVLGYARASTGSPPIERQREMLIAGGAEIIFAEADIGSYRSRFELGRLLDELEAGDTLLVTSADRLAASVPALLKVADQARRVGAHLRALKDPWLDTASREPGAVWELVAGLASLERRLARSRAAAPLRGARPVRAVHVEPGAVPAE
ncbi:MAG: recombinase family protein [Acetobacteraceae bacterium]|nr:recombinase family protein [Acetobacteraceae bacterium]